MCSHVVNNAWHASSGVVLCGDTLALAYDVIMCLNIV